MEGRELWRALNERLKKEIYKKKYRGLLRFLNHRYDPVDKKIKHILTDKEIDAGFFIDQGPCEINYKGYQRTTKARLMNKPKCTVPHEHPIRYDGYTSAAKKDM